MSNKEYKELNYEVMVDDNNDEICSVHLNGNVYRYLDPSFVRVGSLVFMDNDINDEKGIVTEIRSGKNGMTYYDVGNPDTLHTSEVAMFRVHRVMIET